VIDKPHYHQLEIGPLGTGVQQHNEARESISVPGKAAWLLHIPEIVDMLEAFDVPVIDRSVIEQLFGLRRRRAITLLHRFGGYQAGRTFLVERQALIDQLRHIAEGEEFQREQGRKERLGCALDELRRHRSAARVKIPVSSEAFSMKLAGLSPGVQLEAGHLHIEFSGAEDLLSKLFELSQAANNDFDRFRSVAEPALPQNP